MDHERTAAEILQSVGGQGNMSHAIHCQSRLRLTLIDHDIVDDAKVMAVDGVLGTRRSGEVYQVVVGGEVSKVYRALMSQVGTLDGSPTSTKPGADGHREKRSIVDNFTETMAAIFTPVGFAIVAVGLVAALRITLETIGVISEGDDVSVLLTGFSDAGFRFLPFLVALAAADRFQCNRMIALVIAGILMLPTWATIAADGQDRLLLFGAIPVQLHDYASAIIPPLVTIYVMSKLEHFLKRVLSGFLGASLIPFLEVFVMGTAALVVIGPVTQSANGVVESAIRGMFDTAPGPTSALFAAVYPIMVMTGTHVATFPLLFSNMAETGTDFVLPLMGIANTGLAASALVVYFRTKNAKLKAQAASGALTTGIGLTEPALYGVAVPLRKPLLVACLSGLTGGAVFGIFNVVVHGIGYVPLGTVPLFFGPTFPFAVLGIAVTAVTSMLGTWFYAYRPGDEASIPGFDEEPEEDLGMQNVKGGVE